MEREVLRPGVKKKSTLKQSWAALTIYGFRSPIAKHNECRVDGGSGSACRSRGPGPVTSTIAQNNFPCQDRERSLPPSLTSSSALSLSNLPSLRPLTFLDALPPFESTRGVLPAAFYRFRRDDVMAKNRIVLPPSGWLAVLTASPMSLSHQPSAALRPRCGSAANPTPSPPSSCISTLFKMPWPQRAPELSM
jgi:hypothetical protein